MTTITMRSIKDYKGATIEILPPEAFVSILDK